MKYIISICAAILIILGIIYAVGYRGATKLPENNPQAYLEGPGEPGKKTVVCVGDSITHGRVSCSYVDILSGRPDNRGYTFINAGINGDLAWNVLQRVDDIIHCDPQFITILIGTNDANGSLRESTALRQVKEKGLPRTPDREWFRKNLSALCDMLREKTGARIALLSLPPIGEDRNHEAYIRAGEYSAIIKDTARQKKLAYIPLNEEIHRFLDNKPRLVPASPYDDAEMVMYRAIFMKTIFGKTFDGISQSNGFYLLTDYLHLNCTAADLVADNIEKFLNQ